MKKLCLLLALLILAICLVLTACKKQEPKQDETNISEESVVYSAGLEFVSNGDGTCYVAGIGSCIDTDLVIPLNSPNGDAVIGIGEWAFEYCENLTSIRIFDNIIDIGNAAFFGCSSLKNVEIPSSITSINENAFDSCASLINIEIPDSVVKIESSAFYGCKSLTSIVIPNSIVRIENYAFQNCSALTRVAFADNSQLMRIGEGAFDGCCSLMSITIPNSVTSIDNYAFYDCSALEGFNVESENLAYCSIGNCLVETKSKTLIAGCKNSSIPSNGSVTCIENGAFGGCSSLTNITIPSSITKIGLNTLSGCTALENIFVEKGNPVYHSTGNCLIETKTKTLIAGCKNSVIPTDGSVTIIEDSAFRNCSSLASITIPKSVTRIGFTAFAGCTSLTSIAVMIGNPVYHSCENCIIGTKTKALILGCKSSVIPNDGSVTSIQEYAFCDCTSLPSIIIPDSVTRIEFGAFWGCLSLTNVEIQGDVTSISAGAFYQCNDLISISFTGATQINRFESVTFYRCTSLASIIIPDNVKSIEDYAFSGCTSLKSVTIPNSVTHIKSGAFRHCVELTDIIYQGSVEQWSSVIKENNWDSFTGSYTIHCTDGDITK